MFVAVGWWLVVFVCGGEVGFLGRWYRKNCMGFEVDGIVPPSVVAFT
jgi:hypothetical protein